MKLLLTNDDGIQGEGLHEMAKALSKNHEVWIVAPHKNRSAVSHGITMSNPLCIKKIEERVYSCTGVPADCTLNGIKAIMKCNPDAVISGINKGANLGTDIIYSGTVAAARQAAFYGVPAIAVSLESFDDKWNYQPLANFVAQNLEKLVSFCSTDVFLNINAKSTNSYQGYKITVPTVRTYHDEVQVINAPDGHSYSFFKGGRVTSQDCIKSDCNAVNEGFISVSRIYAQPVATEFISEMENAFIL